MLLWYLLPSTWHPLTVPFLLAMAGIWSADQFAGQLNQKDPRCVVIDEVAGMALALAALPRNWRVYLAALVLFRLLDIVKPGPIRKAEQLPGGWGIMADDLLAGLTANLLIRGFEKLILIW
jgi:phosphatidylglycerophosphatase A